VLLAGGAARRFGGSPKGLATIGRHRIADHVLMALAEATEMRAVVCNDERAAAWFPGHRIVPDRDPGQGPLAGLATALRAAEGLPAIVVAWDMPFVTGGLLRSLRRRGEIAEACNVPVHGEEGTAEPLCAYYRPEALRVAETLLARGERRARALYEALAEVGGAVTMSDRGFERFGEPERLFMSIDTPEMLAALGGVPPVIHDLA
jgi:molybdopterin-guanine dinucleotide biosynthesis protein A